MSIMLPDWAAGIIGVLGGGTWPEADEDTLFALGAAWKRAAGDLKALDTDLAAAKGAVDVAYPEGKGHDAIVAALDQFLTGKSSFDTLSGFMDQLGDYSAGTGASIEHSKLQILAAAAVTVAMIASAAIPGCQADLPLAWAMLRMALIGILQELFVELIQLEEGHIKSLDGWEIAFSGANMAASELGGKLLGQGFNTLLAKMLEGPIGKAVGEDLLESFWGTAGQKAFVGIGGGLGGLTAGTIAGEAESTILRGVTTGDWHLDNPLPGLSTNMFLNMAVTTGLHSVIPERPAPAAPESGDTAPRADPPKVMTDAEIRAMKVEVSKALHPDVSTLDPAEQARLEPYLRRINQALGDENIAEAQNAYAEYRRAAAAPPSESPAAATRTAESTTVAHDSSVSTVTTADDGGPVVGRGESPIAPTASSTNQDMPPERVAGGPSAGAPQSAASSPVRSGPVPSDTPPPSDEILSRPAAFITGGSVSETAAPTSNSPIAAAPANENATPIPARATAANDNAAPIPAQATAASENAAPMPARATPASENAAPMPARATPASGNAEPAPVPKAMVGVPADSSTTTVVPEQFTPTLDPIASESISRIGTATGDDANPQGPAATEPQNSQDTGKAQDTGKSKTSVGDPVPASKAGTRTDRTETSNAKRPNERTARAVVSADDRGAPVTVDAKPRAEIQAGARTETKAGLADKSFRIGRPAESENPSHQDDSVPAPGSEPPEPQHTATVGQDDSPQHPEHTPVQAPDNSGGLSAQDRENIQRAHEILADLEQYGTDHPPEVALVRTDPDQPPTYEWRRYPDHPGGPLSVVSIAVDVIADPAAEPLVDGLWEKLRLAGDAVFNLGQDLPSGDHLLVELIPATDFRGADMSLYVTETGEFGTFHEGTTVDDLIQRLRGDLGLEPGSGHGLSEDDLYKFSREICRVNTDAMLGGLEHVQRLGTYAELEDRGHQYDLEDILRVPGENRFRIGVNPEEYRRLINPGGPDAPGRGDNCVIASLAALATFYGDPTVAVPRAPVVIDGKMTYTGVSDPEWRQIGPWMGNRPWDNFNDGRPMPEQFDAIRARIEDAKPGSAALVAWGWKVYDAEHNQLFNPDGTPMVSSGHAIVLVYPYDAPGPVWFDPQSGEVITDPRPPDELVGEVASLEYVAFEPPGGTPDATGTEHRGTDQSVSDGGVRGDPPLPGDPLRPLLGVPGDAVPGADRPEGTPGTGQLPGGPANRGGHDDTQLDAPAPGGEAVRRVGPDGPAPAGTADLPAPVPGDHPANAGGSGDDRIPGADRIPGPASRTGQGISLGDHQDQPGLPPGDAPGGQRGGLGAVAGPHERDLAGTGDIRGVERPARAGGESPPIAPGEQPESWRRDIGAAIYPSEEQARAIRDDLVRAFGHDSGFRSLRAFADRWADNGMHREIDAALLHELRDSVTPAHRALLDAMGFDGDGAALERRLLDSIERNGELSVADLMDALQRTGGSRDVLSMIESRLDGAYGDLVGGRPVREVSLAEALGDPSMARKLAAAFRQLDAFGTLQEVVARSPRYTLANIVDVLGESEQNHDVLDLMQTHLQLRFGDMLDGRPIAQVPLAELMNDPGMADALPPLFDRLDWTPAKDFYEYRDDAATLLHAMEHAQSLTDEVPTPTVYRGETRMGSYAQVRAWFEAQHEIAMPPAAASERIEGAYPAMGVFGRDTVPVLFEIADARTLAVWPLVDDGVIGQAERIVASTRLEVLGVDEVNLPVGGADGLTERPVIRVRLREVTPAFHLRETPGGGGEFVVENSPHPAEPEPPGGPESDPPLGPRIPGVAGSRPDRPFSLSTTPNGHGDDAAGPRSGTGESGPRGLHPVRLTRFETPETNPSPPHADTPAASEHAGLVAAREQAAREFRAAFRAQAPEEVLRELARRAGQALELEHRALMDSLNDLPYDDVLRQLDLLDLRDAPLQDQTPVQDVKRALSDTGSAPGGKELIIGGGRAFRPLARGELTVNIDPEARPHLKAGVAEMDALPTGTSSRAVFENVGLDQLTGPAAAQLHRVLEPGGKLVMTTGPRYFAEQGLREAVVRALENAGFTDIRWEFNEQADIRPFFERDDEGTILLYPDGEPRLRWVPESPFQVTATKPGVPEISADNSATPPNSGMNRSRIRPVRLIGFDTGDSNQAGGPDAPAGPGPRHPGPTPIDTGDANQPTGPAAPAPARIRPVRLVPINTDDSNQPPQVADPAKAATGGRNSDSDIGEPPALPAGTQDDTANAYGRGLRPQGGSPNPRRPITIDQITPPQPSGADQIARTSGGQQLQQMMMPPEQAQVQHAPQPPDTSPNQPVHEPVPKTIDPRDLVRQQLILSREQDELNYRTNRRIATEQALTDEHATAQRELDRALANNQDVRNPAARVRAAQEAEQRFHDQTDPDLDELRKRVADRQQAVDKALRQTGRPPSGLYDRVANAEAERRSLRGQRAGMQTQLDQIDAQIDALRQHGNGADPRRLKELLDRRTGLIGDKLTLDEKWVQANIAIHGLLRFGNDQSGTVVDLTGARVIARFELPVSGSDRMQVNFTRQMLDEQVRNGNLTPILPEELRTPISAVRAVLNESGSTPERVRAALDAARSRIDLAARNNDPMLIAYAHRLINELETGSSVPEQHWWQRAAWRNGAVDSQSVTKTMRVGVDIVEAGNGTRYLLFHRLTEMIAYEASRYYFGSGLWDGLSYVLPPVDHELIWHEHFGLGYSAAPNTAVVEASGRRFEQNVDQRDYFAIKINPLAPGPAFVEQHVNLWPESESQRDPATFDPALNLHDVDKMTIKNYWAVNPRIFFNHIALADLPLSARIVTDIVFTSTDNGAPTGAVNYSLQLMGSYSVLENLIQKTLPGILGANHIPVPPDWAMKIPDVGGDSTISLNLNKLFGGGPGAEIPQEMRDALARAGISVDRHGNLANPPDRFPRLPP